MKETDIQFSICEYLALKGYFFWRQNNIPRYNKDRKVYFSMPKYALNGIPDIILIKDGQFIGLEVKTPQGRKSKAQEAFEKGSTEAGAQYHIVRSIEDVQKIGL